MDKVATHDLAAHGHGHAHEHGHAELGFWRKYVFSVDHKVIGIQYAITGLLFLLFGFMLMMIMRWQLAYPGSPIPLIGNMLGPDKASGGIMLPEFYNMLGAMHGTIMVFLGVVPLAVGGFDLGAHAIELRLQALEGRGVFAIGDAIGGAMLAHKASEEGVACVEMMATGHGHVNYDAIPAIVYTNPEIASVGRTEEQLKEAGIEYNKGVCPYGANGRARTLGDTDGRVNDARAGRCRSSLQSQGQRRRPGP